jgi:hypothetical protein
MHEHFGAWPAQADQVLSASTLSSLLILFVVWVSAVLSWWMSVSWDR